MCKRLYLVFLNIPYVPGKCLSLCKHPPLDFDSSVVFQGPLCNHSPSKISVWWLEKFTVWAHIDCSYNHSNEFQVPLQLAARFAHTSHSFIFSILRLQNKICVLQATNAAKPWQWDFGLVCFLAGYSLLYCWAGLIWLKNEAWVKLQRGSIQ